ncbi:MAG: FAD-dependent oxidoreductase [Solirubrobacterales bacterium]
MGRRPPSPAEPAAGLDRPISRRSFLGRGLALGGALIAPWPLAGCGGASPSHRAGGRPVVIVGAGLAGLTCAHRLRQRGVAVALYEARADRVGGRCWTARGFAEGQVAEHGGEFIDSDHARIRALAGELGLRLEDRFAWERRRSGARSLIYLDGSLRRRRQVLRGFGALKRRLRVDAVRTGYLTGSYESAAARRFDALSARDWLERNVPGGPNSLLGQVVSEYLTQEFGLDPARLSATNLFYILEKPGSDPVSSDGSDERFHVHGGNDRIPRRLAAGLPAGTLRMDAPLHALWRRGDGCYGMRFGGVASDVIAERVVLAIPFTTLRRVDLGRAGLSSLKRRAIAELGMGTNSKLLMQFRHRPARFRRWNGDLVSDHPPFDTWDTSLTQRGRTGLLTIYTGGAAGRRYRATRAHGPAPARVVRETLAALERAVSGISEDFNGRAWLDQWSADPWSRGSYSAFLPGQVTDFLGAIARAEGGLHFAGEHTSVAYQGFLEGAVRSGERCAGEVLGSPPAALHAAAAFA